MLARRYSSQLGMIEGGMQREESGMPFVVIGLIVALVLIVLTFQARPPDTVMLQRQFTPRPPDPREPTLAALELPQVSLPDLPPDMQTTVQDLTKQLAGGQSAPPLTPVAQSTRARVTVTTLRKSGDHLSVSGTVTNIGTDMLTITPEAFLFRDSAGVTYATEGSGAAQLKPGEQTSFDLSVPLPPGRGLALVLTLPPDPPLEQNLIVEIK
jgi:hypothetical protein